MLPAFHAMTGFDNISTFYNVRKKSWWNTLALYPQVASALNKLADGDYHGAKRELERFVIMT